MFIFNYLDQGARLSGNRTCLEDTTSSLNYHTTQRISNRFAKSLIRDGIKKGDRISIYSGNNATALACSIGIARVGAVSVQINIRNTAEDNTKLLAQSNTKILLYHSQFEDVAQHLLHEISSIEKIICIDKREAHLGHDLTTWLADEDTFELSYKLDENDPALMVFSGGTTGDPKRIMLSHKNIEVMTKTFCMELDFPEQPVFLGVAPMTHAAGCFMYPIMSVGGKIQLMDKVDPQEILQSIDRFRVSHIFLPPTVIYMLLAQENVAQFDYSSLRNFIYAAAPMSTEKLKQAIKIFGPVMTQYYGQSEAPMAICSMLPADHVDSDGNIISPNLASCGRGTSFVTVEVMSEDGQILPSGDAGEIVVRSDLVMCGYEDDPEANAEVSKFGWHHTGDIGFKNENGFVFIVDRKKDMIISGGFNIFPSEVEQVLWQHPAIQDCAVIGVPDEKWGEAVKAVIELKTGASADTQKLIKYCRNRLSGVKTPKSIEIWDSLPRSSVGKVLKREIRARFWEHAERAI